MPSISALILAAGGSTRMHRPKQLLRIDGESLVHRSARAALEAGCAPVVVVTGAQAHAIAPEVADLPVQIALNADWPKGMGGSIRAGLEALLKIDANIEAAMILLCDQPRLSAKVLTDLTAAFLRGRKPIAACRYAATLGPPCCFAKSLFNELLCLADAEGAKKLLLKDPSRVTAMDWTEGECDLDTPGDWQRFCKTANPSPESAP